MKIKKNKDSYGKRALFVLVIIVLLSLLFIQGVYALGITPGRAVFDFSPGREAQVAFKIINNEHKEMKVAIEVYGELNGSVKLEKKIFYFKASDYEKETAYTFKLPNTLNGSGIHEARIVAMEIPSGEESGTLVSATVAVATQLYVQVPYPGKYLESRIDIQESEVNETTKFFIGLSNFGSQKIGKVYIQLEVLDDNGRIISELISDTKEIANNKRKDFVISWKANVEAGKYIARAKIIYDDNIASIEKKFSVGSARIDILNVLVQDFRLGGIAKFILTAQSRWASPINDVYANLLLYSEGGTALADSRSANVNFPPLSKEILLAYWDTVGVEQGDYNGKIILSYLNNTDDRSIMARVRTDRLEVEVVGLTANVVGVGASNKSNFLLILLIVVLLLVNLAWFLYFKRKVHKKQKVKKINRKRLQ
jgi:hypothetical protein